jgi:hypothetical protein
VTPVIFGNAASTNAVVVADSGLLDAGSTPLRLTDNNRLPTVDGGVDIDFHVLFAQHVASRRGQYKQSR